MSFDAQTFMDEVTTEAAVRRPPIGAGTQLVGEILDISVRVNQGKQDPSKTYTGLDVKIKCDTTMVAGQPEQVTLKDGFVLDLNDSGNLDWSVGKNRRLGMYRESLGMNVAGQPFSIKQMLGRGIKITVKHRIADDGQVYEEVGQVMKV